MPSSSIAILPSLLLPTLLLLLLLPRSAIGQVTCLRQLSTCSCETADGVVDLAPLSSPAGYPFSGGASGGQDTFQWSPCLGQLCGNQMDTAVCETYGTNKLPVGQSDTAQFVTHPARGLQLVYTDTRTGVQYTSYVVLVCDPAVETAVFSAEGGIYELFMHLRSKYACPGAGQGGGGGGNGTGLSTGDVLCIVVGVGAILYICLGLGFNKFLLGKQGADLLPNRDFWTALPGLVKDGCLCTVGRLGCKRRGAGAAAYESLG